MNTNDSIKTQEHFTITMTSDEAVSILAFLEMLPDGPLSYSQAVTDFYLSLCEAYKNVR